MASFRTVSVKEKVSIKKFVEDNGLEFSKGSGYYQLTKPETVQEGGWQHHLWRSSQGSLGIKTSSKKFSLDLSSVPDFDVFVQSTSVNRVLLPDTEFLYEEEEATVMC